MSARSWWRANAVPVGILVVLLPASVWAITWHDRTVVHLTSGQRVTASVAEEGKTVDLSGATWGPIRSAAIDDTSSMTPPPNTKVIGVAIPVHIDPDDPVLCERPVLIEQSTGRQWNEMSFELGITIGENDAIECSSFATEDYEIIVPFAVPEDSTGPYWVDIVPYKLPDGDGVIADPTGEGGTGLDGKFVRFPIDPR